MRVGTVRDTSANPAKQSFPGFLVGLGLGMLVGWYLTAKGFLLSPFPAELFTVSFFLLALGGTLGKLRWRAQMKSPESKG